MLSTRHGAQCWERLVAKLSIAMVTNGSGSKHCGIAQHWVYGDTWIWEPALWHCSALGIWWYMDLGASTVVMLSIGHDDTWTWEQTMWQCSALGIVTRRPGSSRAHFSFISGHDCVLPHKIDPLYTRTCTGTEHFSRFFTFLPPPHEKEKSGPRVSHTYSCKKWARPLLCVRDFMGGG